MKSYETTITTYPLRIHKLGDKVVISYKISRFIAILIIPLDHWDG